MPEPTTRALDDGDVEVTEVWSANQERLLGLAYRMLGSVSDAQDMVQEAFIRLRSVHLADVARSDAWLTTVVTRLCLNHLASARVRRERYVGPWLPEPVETTVDPAEDLVTAESISAAFLVVLEVLSPAERAAFVLHDVFGCTFGEVAEILGRSEAACRQLASRARSAIQARRPRFTSDSAQRLEVSKRFLQVCTNGDLDGLLEVLAPDVVLYNDGGGKARAARRVISGAEGVARFLSGVLARRSEWSPTPTSIHGGSGLAWYGPTGSLVAVLSATVDDDGQIATVAMVVNPDKLRHLGSPRDRRHAAPAPATQAEPSPTAGPDPRE